MIIQPRNFIWKKRQKKRSIIYSRNKINLFFGNNGLITLKPTNLTGVKIFRLKLFLKRSIKKPDKTHRKFWFNAFPHLPMSKKTLGLRMGKGKGKLACWFIKLPSNYSLVEFKNLRLGRANFFSNQISHKLGIPCTFFYINKKIINSPLLKKNKITLL